MSSDFVTRKRNVLIKKIKKTTDSIPSSEISTSELPVTKLSADEVIYVQKDIKVDEYIDEFAMSSDSAASKQNVQKSTDSIPSSESSKPELSAKKSSADEVIHVQKDIKFGENWRMITLFFVISGVLAGVGYYLWYQYNFTSVLERRDSLQNDWHASVRVGLFPEDPFNQEPIDEEPSIDVQLEPSYLDILWSYYPFGENDESPSSSVVPPESELESDASKESENDKYSNEDYTKELINDNELDNDEDDVSELESEENLGDEKNIEDDNDQKGDNDENADSKSTEDSENTYESFNYFTDKKQEVEGGEKDGKDEVDSSDESNELVNRRNQRFNYYHLRESDEEHKYKYIKGEDDSNDSSEQRAHEKFDSGENAKDEDEQDEKDGDDDSHSSEEAEPDPFIKEDPNFQIPDIDEEPQSESGSMITKLSVGIALIFVAYSVIIRKWNNYVNRVVDGTYPVLANIEANDGDLDDISKTIADDLLNSIKNKLIVQGKALLDHLETPSNSAGEQSEDDSANEPTEDEIMPIGSEKSQTPSETESEIDDDYAEYGEVKYDRMNITNRADWPYRHQLDEADDDFDRFDFFNSTAKYLAILKRSPRSVRAQYGLVKYHDRTFHPLKKSVILYNIIKQYKQILKTPDVPEIIEKVVADKLVERMRVLEEYKDTIPVFQFMIKKYPKELSYQVELAITYLILNRSSDAESVLSKVLERDPNNGLALVNYGYIKKLNGELRTSVDPLVKGIRSGVKGTEDGRFYYHLGEALQRLGRTDTAFSSAVEKGIFLSTYQRSLYNVIKLKGQPWWNPADTIYKDFFQSLERNWKTIRDEIDSALQKEDNASFQNDAEQLCETGDWKQLQIYYRGKETSECNKFPVTCGLIKGFAPVATCRRGQVKFSIMEPGTHIWPHCGPTNCRLRAHLGLSVPENVSIRVAEETRTWRNGEVLLFDDSFEHEVWHNGTSRRVILIVDIWHPDLSETWRSVLPEI